MGGGMADFAKFESRPRPVSARRLFIDTQVMVGGISKVAPAGMWLVKAEGGTGECLMMPDDVFRLSFRPTDTQSEAAWKERTNLIAPQWKDGVEPLSN